MFHRGQPVRTWGLHKLDPWKSKWHSINKYALKVMNRLVFKNYDWRVFLSGNFTVTKIGLPSKHNINSHPFSKREPKYFHYQPNPYFPGFGGSKISQRGSFLKMIPVLNLVARKDLTRLHNATAQGRLWNLKRACPLWLRASCTLYKAV